MESISKKLELTETEKKVVQLREKERMTFVNIGKVFYLSPGRIGQIYKTAKRKQELAKEAENISEDTPIQAFMLQMGASVRAAHAVQRTWLSNSDRQIETVGDLADYDGDLERIRNVGKKTLPEIIAARDIARKMFRKGENHDAVRENS